MFSFFFKKKTFLGSIELKKELARACAFFFIISNCVIDIFNYVA